MVHTIVLNSSNIVGTYNNKFVYNLSGTKSTEGCEIALQGLYMYYSWANINAATNQNNTYQITFPPLTLDADGATLDNPVPEVTYTITMPDGIYDIDAINYYLQNFCIDNNLYLVNSTGENVYFLQLQLNMNQYRIQFNQFAIPYGGQLSAVGLTQPIAGFCNNSYTQAAGGGTYANGAFPETFSTYAPGWYFPNNFADFVGFSQPTYQPSESQRYFVLDDPYPLGSSSFIGTQAMNAQPNDVLYLNCNLVSNKWTNPSTFLYPIAAGGNSIGEQIRINPPEFAFSNMQPGVASQIICTITTKEGKDIQIMDPQTLIVLLIREPADKFMTMGPESAHGKPSAPNLHALTVNPNQNSSAKQLSNLHRKVNKYSVN